jgi:hypothetical protein
MMSGSQLEVEYKDMADRRELYAKYGIAAEAAQLFETELGTMLLCFRALEKDWHIVPDRAAAREALDSIDRSTLGRLLNDLKRFVTIEADLEKNFSSALRARNRLMHGFFERHNFSIQNEDGRREMIADLDRLHGELFAAWRAADRLSTALSAVVRQGAQERHNNE